MIGRSPRRPGRRRRWLAVAAALTLGAGGAAIPAGRALAGAARGLAPREPHVANPYLGAAGYVDPQWRALAAGRPDGDLVAATPTGVWLDRAAKIAGTGSGLGLREHLDAALAQGAGYVQVVLNNLPARDCGRMRQNGDFAVDELARYRAEFVDPVAGIEGDPRYGRLRIVNVLEVNALASLAGAPTWSLCAEPAVHDAYVDGIRYALDALHRFSNVYIYLSAGNHQWLGWDTVAAPAAQLLLETVRGTAAGVSAVDGVAVNVADYAVLTEPYLTADTVVGGVPVRWSRWVDWNSYVDELPFVAQLRTGLVAMGFSAGIGMLVDTSRNGWGGPDRPTGPSASTDLNTFVDQSRTDRRIFYGNWCNQAGAGLGQRPVAAPLPGVDAYAWLKAPGVSDGTGDPALGEDPANGYDQMCDPAYRRNPENPNLASGALPGAPPAGQWFPAAFDQLLANAWPPLR